MLGSLAILTIWRAKLSTLEPASPWASPFRVRAGALFFPVLFFALNMAPLPYATQYQTRREWARDAQLKVSSHSGHERTTTRRPVE